MSLPRCVYNPNEPQQSMSLANLRNTLRALFQGDLMPLRARASMSLDLMEYATNSLAQANWLGTGITISTTTTKQEGNFALQAIIDATGDRTLQSDKSFNLSAFRRIRFWERCSVGGATFRFFLRDNSGNESYWNCISDNANIWKQFDLDLSSPNSNNGNNANLTNIVSFGFNQLGASRTFIFDHIIAICGLNVAVEGGLIADFYQQVYIGQSRISFTGGSSPVITPPSANPRIDLLTLNTSGVLEWTQGTEASTPSEPSFPVGKIPICLVYCKETMTRIVDYENKDANPTEGYILKDVRPLLLLAMSTMSSFLALTDTPSSYSGQGLRHIRVNSTENALEFVDLATLAVLLSGDQTIEGVKTFASIPVLPATDPTTDNQAVRRGFATATPTANKIPLANGDGKLATGWLYATTTPTADRIPISGSDSKLADGWLPGFWKRIYSTEITSNTTSVTVSGLNGDTDIEYMIICRFRSQAGSVTTQYFIRPNNDSGSNYSRQVVTASGTSMGAVRDVMTGILVGVNDATGQISFSSVLLYAKSGYIRQSNTFMQAAGGTGLWIALHNNMWNNTTANITSIVFVATQTNGIGVGSFIEIWARR